MKPLLVLGASTNAAVFIDVFQDIRDAHFVGCVENMDPARCAQRLLDLPIHWYEDIDDLRDSHALVCALGTTRRADWIAGMEARGFGFERLVHPSSVVSRRTELGPGVSIDAMGVVAGFTTLAPHVRVGRRCSIGHHTVIGRCSTIHPGAVISGNCRIGSQVTIGTGAVIIDGMEVGDGAYVAAGAVVTKPVAPNTLVAGNPAILKRGDYGPR